MWTPAEYFQMGEGEGSGSVNLLDCNGTCQIVCVFVAQNEHVVDKTACLFLWPSIVEKTTVTKFKLTKSWICQ